jgi:hypothetical protein
VGNDLCREAVDITRERLREAGATEVDSVGTVVGDGGGGGARRGQLGLSGLTDGLADGAG